MGSYLVLNVRFFALHDRSLTSRQHEYLPVILVRRGFSPYSMLMKNKYFKRSPTIDQAVAPVPPADYWPVEGDQYEQTEY